MDEWITVRRIMKYVDESDLGLGVLHNKPAGTTGISSGNIRSRVSQGSDSKADITQREVVLPRTVTVRRI
jgi:hypothetical protein